MAANSHWAKAKNIHGWQTTKQVSINNFPSGVKTDPWLHLKKYPLLLQQEVVRDVINNKKTKNKAKTIAFNPAWLLHNREHAILFR